MRRYNATSARILAAYLASQDNPERALCPNLKTPKAPPAALDSLVFRPCPPKVPSSERPAKSVKPNGGAGRGAPTARAGSKDVAAGDTKPAADGLEEHIGPQRLRAPGFSVEEEPERKDYRSFAANMFSSVAFKMLEWLTQPSIAEMSRKAESFRAASDAADQPSSLAQHESNGHARIGSRSGAVDTSPSATTPAKAHASRAGEHGKVESAEETVPQKPNKRESGLPKSHQKWPPSPPATRPGGQRRNSKTSVRTPSGPDSRRKLSIDRFTPDSLTDSGLLKSPRAPVNPPDWTARSLKAANAALTRPISQLSSAGFFDDVTLERMPPPKPTDLRHIASRACPTGPRGSENGGPKERASGSTTSSSRSSSNRSAHVGGAESEDDIHLPQTLTRLNADVVDFICDLVQEDGTAEKHMLEPPAIAKFHSRHTSQGKLLKRTPHPPGRKYPADVKREWKLFVEQTIFYILSDPRLAIRSFAKKGQLYDSQTLWYCMLRMTRIAPSLVFHSLWMAAGSLFAPPEPLRSLQSPLTKAFSSHGEFLSNAEAGRLLSICLHALVAAAPLVKSAEQLYDMSKLRSHGLILATSGAVAKQPTSLCLEYEDCFTNDLAMRLAKRLFAAITVRRSFDEIYDSNQLHEESGEPDVLTPLFSQLDFVNMDAVYILNFSLPDRTLHETRVPILLLDWARAVMVNDWDGRAEIPRHSPFGGALALIDAMCELLPTPLTDELH